MLQGLRLKELLLFWVRISGVVGVEIWGVGGLKSYEGFEG